MSCNCLLSGVWGIDWHFPQVLLCLSGSLSIILNRVVSPAASATPKAWCDEGILERVAVLSLQLKFNPVRWCHLFLLLVFLEFNSDGCHATSLDIVSDIPISQNYITAIWSFICTEEAILLPCCLQTTQPMLLNQLYSLDRDLVGPDTNLCSPQCLYCTFMHSCSLSQLHVPCGLHRCYSLPSHPRVHHLLFPSLYFLRCSFKNAKVSTHCRFLRF